MADIYYGIQGTYDHLKFLVRGDADFNRIRGLMPWNTPDTLLREFINRANQEIHFEDVIKNTEIGKLLYE
jgi:hypothetical protein